MAALFEEFVLIVFGEKFWVVLDPGGEGGFAVLFGEFWLEERDEMSAAHVTDAEMFRVDVGAALVQCSCEVAYYSCAGIV